MNITNLFNFQPFTDERLITVSDNKTKDNLPQRISNQLFALGWGAAAFSTQDIAYAGAQYLRDKGNTADLNHALFLAGSAAALTSISALAVNAPKTISIGNKVIFSKGVQKPQEKPNYYALIISGLLFPGLISAGASALNFSMAGIRTMSEMCQQETSTSTSWYTFGTRTINQANKCDQLFDNGVNLAIASVLLLSASLAVAVTPSLVNRVKKIYALSSN